MEVKEKETKVRPKGEGETDNETKRTRPARRKSLANSSIQATAIVNGEITADIAMRERKEERENLHSSCPRRIRKPRRRSLQWSSMN
jgi:hypothetical protein